MVDRARPGADGAPAAPVIRVTGGALRGRTLPARVPEGVRPTAGRVREAVFSMVGQDLRGWSVLDLFGGSGLIGIEAASRGAAPVVIVERNPKAAAAIRRNLEALDHPAMLRVGDAASPPAGPFDFIYLDPPFKEDVAPWVARVAPLCLRVIVAEARAGSPVPAPPGGWRLERTRVYGDTQVALYVRIGAVTGAQEVDEVLDDPGVVEDDG